MKRIPISVFVYSLVGILAFSCNSRNSTQETPRAIDPDKFALALEDKSTLKNNFVRVNIIPGSPSMRVEDFELTAHISDSRGIVRAASRDDTGNLIYNIDCDAVHVSTFDHRLKKARDDHEGMPIVVRIQAIPNDTIRKGESYTLTVSVSYQGSKPHTETKSLTLTARRDGDG